MNSIPDIHAFTGKIARRLKTLYPETFSESHVNRILGMIAKHSGPGPLWDEKDIVLITYGNSITSKGELPLVTLGGFLKNRLNNIVSCVHILPFFPSTSDDGFAVCDFDCVSPDLGNWDDIADIGADFGLMFDLVLNHVSASHPWFKNYCIDLAPGRDYFIEFDPSADYRQVTRPRSTPLFTAFKTHSGIKNIWTTFSADQVDLNYANPDVLIEMIRVLLLYISKGARILRLDAVAFLWKVPGTSCLHLSQTHEVIKLIRDIAEFVNPRIIILTETNVPNLENWSYFGRNDEAHMVYQFTLPPLILYTLFTGNSYYLNAWAVHIPTTGFHKSFLNFTASHDGIGIRPLEGILPEKEIQSMINGIKQFGGQVSEKRNSDGSSAPYELNITYPDALKGTYKGIDDLREKRFLCSQFIMLAMQGIPAIYINSLAGAENDNDGMKETGQARRINRKKWDVMVLSDLISTKTKNKKVFDEYVRVIKIRRQTSAFHPGCPQEFLNFGNAIFALSRKYPEGGEILYCISNITDHPVLLTRDKIPFTGIQDILADEILTGGGEIIFEAYQTRWLKPF